jgi:hypothetical protein
MATNHISMTATAISPNAKQQKTGPVVPRQIA